MAVPGDGSMPAPEPRSPDRIAAGRATMGRAVQRPRKACRRVAPARRTSEKHGQQPARSRRQLPRLAARRCGPIAPATRRFFPKTLVFCARTPLVPLSFLLTARIAGSDYSNSEPRYRFIGLVSIIRANRQSSHFERRAVQTCGSIAALSLNLSFLPESALAWQQKRNCKPHLTAPSSLYRQRKQRRRSRACGART
jgi:hypothetical protein